MRKDHLEQMNDLKRRMKRTADEAKEIEAKVKNFKRGQCVKCPECGGPAYNKINPGLYKCSICSHSFSKTEKV